MELASSKLLGLDAFSAPFSEDTLSRLLLAGFVTPLLEDLPQFGLQLFALATINADNYFTIVSLCLTCLSAINALLSRGLRCCAESVVQRATAAAETAAVALSTNHRVSVQRKQSVQL